MTLARLPKDLTADEAQDLRDFTARRAGITSPPFRAEAFTLFRSSLGRNGAIYDALADYPLRVS